MTHLKLASLFVLFLVVTMTPISATNIANSLNSTKNQTDNLYSSQNSIEEQKQLMENELSSIKNSTDSLNSTMEKISDRTTLIQDDINFILANWWKFWMWGEVGHKISELFSLISELQGYKDDIKTATYNINTAANKLNNTPITYNFDENSGIDATEIAYEIGKSLKIPISVVPIGSNNDLDLKEGDIIQYRSYNKHFRYLLVKNISKNNIVFAGPSNKTKIFSIEDVKANTEFKLTSNSTVKKEKILNKIYNYQYAKIYEKLDLADANKLYANKVFSDGKYVLFASGGCTVPGWALLILGVILFFSCELDFGVGAVIGLLLIVIGNFLIYAGVILFIASVVVMGVSSKMNSNADNQLKLLNEDLLDLDRYGGPYNNHAPVAKDMNLTTRMDKKVNGTLNATNLRATDVLNYIINKQPQHGTLNLVENGSFEYIPSTNFTGNDSFEYMANDGKDNSNIAFVNITINPNSPPSSQNMTLTTRINKFINSTFNATDPDNDTLAYTIVEKPLHGTLNITGNSFIYIPFANYTGNDTFTYKANDGLIDSNIASVTIKISRLQKFFENIF